MNVTTEPSEAPAFGAHYDTLREGRNHLKDLLDAAARGHSASLTRGGRRAAIVDADRLRRALTLLRPANAQVVAENGGFSVLLPGLPIAADGATLDDALDEVVDALREYATDWEDRLSLAPNHADNWGLVQLVALSSDAQLKAWLVSE